MTYSITGQSPILSKGIMASASGLLYDSSNLHLILKNSQWLVSVDFPSDFISVVKNNPAKGVIHAVVNVVTSLPIAHRLADDACDGRGRRRH